MMNAQASLMYALVMWYVSSCTSESESTVGELIILPTVGPCHSAPCLNAGSCFMSQVSSVSYSCQCLHGFTGLNCEMGIDECASSPCLNGACVDNIGSFRCMCFPGYKGRLCETEVDQCDSAPCLNGGTCVQPAPGSYTCDCHRGFRGLACETDIDECLSLSPCQHGGTCSQGPPGTYTCACREGYTGVDCESELDGCDPNPCQNGGQCVQLGTGFQCHCGEGYFGGTCDSEFNVCVNNPCGQGVCQPLGQGQYQCDCGADVVAIGVSCEHLADPCRSLPCHNNGTCIREQTGSFRCACTSDYTGTSCEQKSPSCQVDKAVSCRNGGTCHRNSFGHEECLCTAGFKGATCEQTTDPCYAQPCQNNGTCRNFRTNSNLYLCDCLPEYSGVNCQFHNTTGISTNGGLIIFGGRVNPILLFSILGILVTLAALVGTSALIIRKRQARKPHDFCFSLPSIYYQYLDQYGSIASSGRFQRGATLDSDECLHSTTELRY